MAAQYIEKPLLVIVGPTASGKTDLAIAIAKQVDAEIIAADSRTVYRGMDIGTAKPGISEREGVLHHGFDLVEPNQRFTAADFQQYAKLKISDIRGRNKIPIMVGGAGLYIDAVLYDYQFGCEMNAQDRQQLNEMTISELQNYCNERNIELPSNTRNKRHLVRAIEQKGVNRKRNSSILDNSFIVGIAIERCVLRSRIEARTHKMFAQGVVYETTKLAEKYGWQSQAMTGSVYPIIRKVLAGELSEDEAIAQNITRDMQLAKRQMTWFRRNPNIHWVSDPAVLIDYCLTRLK